MQAACWSHLAGSVDDITIVLDVVVLDGLCEGALDGRVVVVHKVVLDELNDERRLPW